MMALRVVQGIARTVAERVSDLKNSPLSEQPLKRQMLRLWAEYSLGTINKLLAMKSGDGRTAEEKEFIRRLTLTRRDIHSQLRSVGSDIDDGTND
ncbi:TPA: hypothetical protein ACWSZJ_004190 [Escherichia coli]|uniref:hypothetical protein n=1 Tax=Escherichia coli TaxID=562 RepID=UPI0003EE8284|nr:hypothetical protein [Escherichia coli]HDQ6466713.1 hypothetical protein [Escherichia coli O11 str. Bi632-42]HDR9861725.1 hypothetical protein [Escherichia coli O10 str. Bi8337-41]EFL5761282.1 hypothetical protein [Escherichia coli]MBC0425754.1 hypothetical protein [Escherichia coli]MCN7399505.1 hypothetical protein [Escherichia coli]